MDTAQCTNVPDMCRKEKPDMCRKEKTDMCRKEKPRVQRTEERCGAPSSKGRNHPYSKAACR